MQKKKQASSNCESCVHYDYNEYTDRYECNVDLDEDEYLSFLCDRCRSCPHYRYYDEYTSVRRQN